VASSIAAMPAGGFVVVSSAGKRTVGISKALKVAWIIGIVNGHTVSAGEKP
jgi:hypothetical protein